MLGLVLYRITWSQRWCLLTTYNMVIASILYLQNTFTTKSQLWLIQSNLSLIDCCCWYTAKVCAVILLLNYIFYVWKIYLFMHIFLPVKCLEFTGEFFYIDWILIKPNLNKIFFCVYCNTKCMRIHYPKIIYLVIIFLLYRVNVESPSIFWIRTFTKNIY